MLTKETVMPSPRSTLLLTRRCLQSAMVSLALCLSLSFSLELSSPAHAQGIDCEQPNILFVLDYSGSMNRNNKWTQAIDALTQVTVAFDARLRFGLMHFPTDGDCGVGGNYLWSPVAAQGGADVRQSLMGRSPSGNTPLARSVERAIEYYDQLNDQSRKNIIVMITDGGETCGGDPVNACSSAAARNYPTYVIGFGNGVDGNTLRRMAEAGGTQNYYQANDSTQLFEALQTIAQQATDEICDNQDNDCDGLIDEQIDPIPCDSNCGIGEKICLPGGMLSDCQGGQIPMESCDNQDNDCDGVTDEVESVPCEVDGQLGVAECLPGGELSECDPGERAEICDGLDNDVDGIIDENTESECSNGCHLGRILCVEGQLTPCTAAPVSEETCNGFDDDCDEKIDEMSSCVGAELCGEEGQCLEPCQSGECREGYNCLADNYCHPTPCSPECPEGYRCNAARVCVVPCTVDSQCAPYQASCDFDRQECDLEAPTQPGGPGIGIYTPDPDMGAPSTPAPMPGGSTAEGEDLEAGSASCQSASGGSSLYLLLLLLLGVVSRELSARLSAQGDD